MLRLALIGKGKWGSKYLQVAQRIPECTIKYIKTRNYQDLYEYTDVDGIIIATPDSTHSEIIRSFPNSYLLVEKPLVTSLKDAEEITNTKIMVGHIYIYNRALLHAIHRVRNIHNIHFLLSNTEPGVKTTPLWHLAPHPISLSVYLFGVPRMIIAEENNGNIFATLYYKNVSFSFETGWNYPVKKRSISISGNREIVFTDLVKQKVSPLENELRSFIRFIQGGGCETGLEHGKQVIQIINIIDERLRQYRGSGV